MEAFRKHLESVQATNEAEISTRLLAFPDIQKALNLSCSFYLVKCTAQEVREKDLAEFAVDKIARYVLRREEIIGAGTNPDLHSKILRKARTKFIQGRETREPGELLLFLFLESRGIVQVLSKMSLKTSGEMYFHGLDAVHVGVTDNVMLHLGQSKMMQDFGTAVNNALDDLEVHATSVRREDIEVDLLSSYIDDSKFEAYTELIRDLVDPYSSDRSKYAEAFSVLVSSDFDFLKEPYAVPSGSTLEQYLAKQFGDQQNGLCSMINTKLAGYPNVSKKPTHFYVLPFANVSAFCRVFLEVLKT